MYSLQHSGIKLVVEGDDLVLDIDTAVPCGIIVTELLTNACKHAFPPNRVDEMIPEEQIINVELESVLDKYILTVRDNGVGFPPDLDPKNSDTLGLRLVNALVKQLRGSINLDRCRGTNMIITFSALTFEKRSWML
jgi:two-component sensor histidine kinase